MTTTPSVRQGLSQLLGSEPDFLVCGQGEDVYQSLRAIRVSDKMGATLLRRMVGGKKAEGTLPMDRLTDREMELFRFIGAGKTVKEIADKLCLSPKTVEAHLEHIKEKLNLKTSAELLRFAIRNSPDAQ